MNVNYLNPFIEASQKVIKDITGLKTELQKVFLRGNSFSGNEVVIMIGLTGTLTGHTILTLNDEMMSVLVERMYAGNADNLDNDLKRSAMAELANMIVGNASALFYKQKMKMFITTPTILTGKKILISNKYPIICIPLIVENTEGVLEINISAVENTNNESE